MTGKSGQTTAYKIALASMMAALALIFSYIEALIPFSIGIPGIKLGIANLVILVSLYILGFGYTLAINVIRILVAGLLFNGLFGALYSLAGGLLSLAVMYLLKKTGLFSTVGISMAGGVAHNLGQLLTAAFLVSTIKLFFYFPVLLFSGIISGILIGIITHLILKKLPASLYAATGRAKNSKKPD
ncbi:Gx transporter family protein [Anaerovorax odorimutans]|uniref:Gx transporter family protein n=1 Tax=Anaerovorax odorimutans TaxID=109327 RepID=A0ABT1RNL3_9FIRM|nr:Gx transporter family protein [Anaerovorax odorimutans]MCQ4636784.1 Gx transporter family protein [Anaerovorax odorimutans]